MPRVGLALVLVWFVSLFVVRSVVQWHRTGWRGVSGAVASSVWNAGALTALGFVAAASAPFATTFAWPAGNVLMTAPVLHVVGALVATVGIVGALVAQGEMGDSWRVGVDATEKTTLVTHGLFGWVRNPFFTFVLRSLVGLVLVLPTVISLLATAFAATGIELQVRAVEEPYLGRVHGPAYDDYCSRTGRFLPGIGRTSIT